MKILSQRAHKHCYLSGSEPSTLFNQVFGRMPTQQELDQIVQQGRGSSGKAAIDMSPGEFTDYLQNESPLGANIKAKAATDAYTTSTNNAISGLQDQKSKLSDQYAELLKTVKGQYDPLINQTTATTGAELSRRGLTPDSTLYQQQVQGALQPVYGAEAANAQAIGQGSISDINTLAGNIANLQLGVAGTSAALPLEYGSLALSQQQLAQALAIAQLSSQTQKDVARIGQQYQVLNPGQFLLNTSGRTYINPSQLMQALGYAGGSF